LKLISTLHPTEQNKTRKALNTLKALNSLNTLNSCLQKRL